MIREVIIELMPNRFEEAKLTALCSLSSKLWNEVNYARRRMFFEEKRVDLKKTYKDFYEKYKTLIGSATTQQILNKNDEAWKSFFSQLKAKKERRLPHYIKRVNPPGYRKRGGKRDLWVILRKDQYRFEGDYVVLKGLGAIGSIRVRYSGRIHIKGEHGRAEIHYDPDERKWYMHVSFRVKEKIVRGEMTRVPMQPLGNKSAGIDIGVNNLIAVYVEDGSTLLVSGKPLKSLSFYWRRRIADYQSTLNKYGLKTSRRLRRMYEKWRRQVRSYINWAVRNAVEWLYMRGVSKIIIGYPNYIAQEPGRSSKVNFEVVHIWSYGYLLMRLVEVAEEYGMSVEFRGEEYTSTTCPLCRTHKEHRRISRGLLKCFRHNKVFNADLVGAYNTLSKKNPITPSPATLSGIGVMRPRPGARLNPVKPGDVAQTSPPTLAPSRVGRGSATLP